MFTGQTPNLTIALDRSLMRLLKKGPASGHAVTRRLLAEGGQPAPLTAGAVYVGLHRLERRGLLAAEWRPVPGRNLSEKWYRITPTGNHRLGGTNLYGDEVATVQQLSVLVVLAIVGGGSSPSASSHARPSHLTIVVSRRAPTSLSDVRRARAEVIRILGAAGVDTDWIIEDTSSLRGPATSSGAGFVAHVVIEARNTQPMSADTVTLGITPPGEGNNHEAYIFIFEEHVKDFAEVYGKPTSSILALVIAHEIGHALLPFPAHATTGVMQPVLDRHALDQFEEHGLLFSTHQGVLIRQRLNECCAITAAR